MLKGFTFVTLLFQWVAGSSVLCVLLVKN